MRDLSGRAVLITGGTSGIGLATGLAFGRRGARCYLTCRWGSADEKAIRDQFAAAEAPAPVIMEADAARDEDVADCMARIATEHEGVDTFVSNVGFAQLVHSFDDHALKGLNQSIGFSAWPLVSHLKAMHQHFGRFPRYAVAVSSCGAQEYHIAYDYAAAAKAVLETLVRYCAERLRTDDCRVNAVRPRWVATPSLDATVGEGFVPFAESYATPGLLQHPAEVANVILALCSGWLDGMRGQVLTVDHGTQFFDNLMRLTADRDHLPPSPGAPKPQENP